MARRPAAGMNPVLLGTCREDPLSPWKSDCRVRFAFRPRVAALNQPSFMSVCVHCFPVSSQSTLSCAQCAPAPLLCARGEKLFRRVCTLSVPSPAPLSLLLEPSWHRPVCGSNIDSTNFSIESIFRRSVNSSFFSLFFKKWLNFCVSCWSQWLSIDLVQSKTNFEPDHEL